MKTLRHIVKIFVVSLVCLLAAGLLCLQFPSVQSHFAKIISQNVSSSIAGEIGMDRIYISFFNKIVIKDFYIADPSGDTLLFSDKLSVGIKRLGILNKNIHLGKVSIGKGYFKLVNSSETNLELTFAPINPVTKDTTSKDFDWTIKAESLRLKDFFFSLRMPHKPTPHNNPETIDFTDMQLSGINMDIRDILFQNSSLSAKVKHVEAHEKCGYYLEDFGGDVVVNSQMASVENLFIRDQWSNVSAHYFHMIYGNAKNLKYYTQKVKMGLDMDNALLSFKTLQAYAPNLEGVETTLLLNGKTSGTVRELSSSGIEIESTTGLTKMLVAFSLNGMPDYRASTIDFNIKNLHTTTKDLCLLAKTVNNMNLNPILGHIDDAIDLSARVSGPLLEATVAAELHSKLGNINIGAKMNARNRPTKLDASLTAAGLQLGVLLKSNYLSAADLSLNTNISLIPAADGGPRALLNAVTINNIGLNGERYHNITATGTISPKIFDGTIACTDPNLDFRFKGKAALSNPLKSKTTSDYQFRASINNLDLARLGLLQTDSTASLQATIWANLSANSTQGFIGTLHLKDLEFTNSTGHYSTTPVSLYSRSSDSISIFGLESGMATIRYSGSNSLFDYLKNLNRGSLGLHLSKAFPGKEAEAHSQAGGPYSLTLECGNTEFLEKVLFPSIYIAPQTRLSLQTDTTFRTILSLNAPRIGYKEDNLKNAALDVVVDTSGIKASLMSDYLSFAGLQLNDTFLKAKAFHDSLDIKTGYTSPTDSLALISASFRIDSPSKLQCFLHPSFIKLDSDTWDLPSASFLLDGPSLQIDSLMLRRDEQYLCVDGNFPNRTADTLDLVLNSIDLGLLNLLSEDFNFAGLIGGSAQITKATEGMRFFTNLHGREVAVNKDSLGTVDLLSAWVPAQRLVRLSLSAQNKNNKVIELRGSYKPENKHVEGRAQLSSLPAALARPFLEGVASELSGYLDGKLQISGNLPQIYVESEDLRLRNLGFTLDFTGVPYIVNGPLKLNREGVFFLNDSITDSYGQVALLSGDIRHKGFKDIRPNVNIDMQSFEALNTGAADNESFYGKAFASGRLRLHGNTQQLNLDVSAITENNTSIHIPLAGVSEAKSTNLLSFVDPPSILPTRDPYDEESGKKEKKKDGTRFGVDLKLQVTPNAEVSIELNRSSSDVLHAFGEGDIHITVDPVLDKFGINGEYRLTNGDYLFQLGIISKKLAILPGGSIVFTGDILKSNLDLTAVYNTKASLNTLLADTSSVSSIRPVQCQLLMSGELLNPGLGFNIDIANIDPMTRARVDAALNTEDKVLRQFMTLLITSSFLPEQESGIVNNSNILYSNATEILSNQINNIFSQLEIPLDVGFNYQKETDTGKDVFDVAISTQLFNNRVIVNGNVGNRQYNNASNNIVGDVDIEFKIDDKGKYRLKVFSHSADQYSNYLDNTQRNGGGFVYQDEFRSFGDLFRRKSNKKKLKNESTLIGGDAPQGKPSQRPQSSRDQVQTTD